MTNSKLANLSSSAGVTRPDWFITGFRQQDLFTVMGSRSLASSHLDTEYELEREEIWSGMILAKGITSGRYIFTATTNWSNQRSTDGEVLVMAWSENGYREALQRLLQVWSPAETRPLELGDGK